MLPLDLSLSNRYKAIQEFLVGWSEAWGYSIFHRFDEMERLISESWFHYGTTEDFSSQHALAQGEHGGRAPGSLIEWVRLIKGLCDLPRSEEFREPRTAFDRGMTPKKKYEVGALLGFLQGEGVQPSSILDIGGGIGHLARHLALELSCPVDSIDRNGTLQRKGLRILNTWPWRGVLNHPVRFIQGEFPGMGDWSLREEAAWAVGLHTCGETAWSQLDLVRNEYSVLNIGCCYEKLDVTQALQRSRVARRQPLPLTAEALFLANRGGIERTLADFIFQQRVQRYRFSLHELLSREGCGVALTEAVGGARKNVYAGAFADYVGDRLEHREGLPPSLLGLSDWAYEDFYRSIKHRVERMRVAAYLRNLLARPLEIAILLDRALFVEETVDSQKWEVQLIQLFDPKISSRNIAVVAKMSSSS